MLYLLLQEIETNSGLIVCPLAYSSFSKHRVIQPLWQGALKRVLVLCIFIFFPLHSPYWCAFWCIWICMDAGGGLCPMQLQWWQLHQDKAGELVRTLLFARFNLSAVHWVNKPEYNVPGSKYLLVIRKRNWMNVILIKQIWKASIKLFTLQMKHCCLGTVTKPPV